MSTSTDPFTKIKDAIVSNAGKSAEKFLLYFLGIMTATNIFGTTPVGIDTKGIVVGALTLIAAALHVSTPTPKSGPNQL